MHRINICFLFLYSHSFRILPRSFLLSLHRSIQPGNIGKFRPLFCFYGEDFKEETFALNHPRFPKNAICYVCGGGC